MKENWSFRRKKRLATALDLIKYPKYIKEYELLLACASISELPSNIRTRNCVHVWRLFNSSWARPVIGIIAEYYHILRRRKNPYDQIIIRLRDKHGTLHGTYIRWLLACSELPSNISTIVRLTFCSPFWRLSKFAFWLPHKNTAVHFSLTGAKLLYECGCPSLNQPLTHSIT